jgi:hypothetical protein
MLKLTAAIRPLAAASATSSAASAEVTRAASRRRHAARRKDLLHLRVVAMVGRGDVDRLNRRVVEPVVERGIDLLDADRPGPFACAFGAAAHHAAHAHAETPRGLDVRADAAAADDGRAEIAENGSSSPRLETKCASAAHPLCGTTPTAITQPGGFVAQPPLPPAEAEDCSSAGAQAR